MHGGSRWFVLFLALGACGDDDRSPTPPGADAGTRRDASLGPDAGLDGGSACGAAGAPCCEGGSCRVGHACEEGRCRNVCPDDPCVERDLGYASSDFYCESANAAVQCAPPRHGACPERTVLRCSDETCDESTGTCGGCDPTDPCFSAPASWRCDGAGGAYECSGRAEGCGHVVRRETCTGSCTASAGCCGGAGQRCCSAETPFCDAGLACTAGVCG